MEQLISASSDTVGHPANSAAQMHMHGAVHNPMQILSVDAIDLSKGYVLRCASGTMMAPARIHPTHQDSCTGAGVHAALCGNNVGIPTVSEVLYNHTDRHWVLTWDTAPLVGAVA